MKNQQGPKQRNSGKKAVPQKKKKNKVLVSIIIAVCVIVPLVYLVMWNAFLKSQEVEKKMSDTTSVKAGVNVNSEKLEAAIALAASQPNETNYIDLSLQYYYAGKYKECADAAKKALTYNANSYAAYNNICSAYNILEYWDEAIAAGKKALEIKPGDQLATNNLKVSTDGKALQDEKIATAISLATTSPSEANYISLGGIYYSARKFELAIAAYQKAIVYNAKSVVAYNNICSAYNELGKWSDAAENCKKALAIDSTYSLAKNNLIVSEGNLKK